MQDLPASGEHSDVQSEVKTQEAATAAMNAELNEARYLIHANRSYEALETCLKVLQREDLPLHNAATLSVLMKDLGQTDVANQIRQLVLDGAKEIRPKIWDSFTALLSASEALADLNALDEAEVMCRRAIELEPNEFLATVSLVVLLARRERDEEAIELAEAFLDSAPDPFPLSIHLVKISDHVNAQSLTDHFLVRAQALCKTDAQRDQLEHLKAAVGQASPELDPHRVTQKLFDEFAETYDHKMAQLNNNGPRLLHAALEDLGFDKVQTRRILDAGCGTGLCAEFLRTYANEIVGMDVSINMLEKSLEKRLYDALARTDLSNLTTYPGGKFDMIVSADVLVYFGALDTVLSNLHAKLHPGGWLLFSVEDASDDTPKTGYKLYTSGRYKHSEEYLVKTLSEIGFPKPSLLKHGHLRNEFGGPVLGTVIAVQKPVLMI